MDGAGNAYVTGYTASTEATFPVTGGPDLTYNGGSRRLRGQGECGRHGARLLRLHRRLRRLKTGMGIAVDGSGNAYVTGYTALDRGDLPGDRRTGPDAQRRHTMPSWPR